MVMEYILFAVLQNILPVCLLHLLGSWSYRYRRGLRAGFGGTGDLGFRWFMLIVMPLYLLVAG